MTIIAPYAEPKQPVFQPDWFSPLEMVTPPSGHVVSLAAAKLHCRVDSDIDEENELFGLKIAAASTFCEQEIPGGRTFLTTTWRLRLAHWWGGCNYGFPWPLAGWAWPSTRGGTLYLPRPPLQSLTVTYYDDSDTLQTLSSSLYEVRLPYRGRGEVSWVGTTTPSGLSPLRKYPVIVDFVAGYGASTDVPAVIRQAILLTVGWMYRDREPTDTELNAVTNLLAVEGYGSYA